MNRVDLEAASHRLRSKGVRSTTNRCRILALLSDTHQALTAAELSAAAEDAGYPIHRISLYRTLDLLVESRLAHRLPSSGGYLLCRMVESGGCHHYLLCRECGVAEEFACWGMAATERNIAAVTAFRIEGHGLEFTGLCLDCQCRENAQTASRSGNPDEDVPRW